MYGAFRIAAISLLLGICCNGLYICALLFICRLTWESFLAMSWSLRATTAETFKTFSCTSSLSSTNDDLLARSIEFVADPLSTAVQCDTKTLDTLRILVCVGLIRQIMDHGPNTSDIESLPANKFMWLTCPLVSSIVSYIVRHI